MPIFNELQKSYIRTSDLETLQGRRSFSSLSSGFLTEIEDILSQCQRNSNVAVAYEIVRCMNGKASFDVMKTKIAGTELGEKVLGALVKYRSRKGIMKYFSPSYWHIKSELAHSVKEAKTLAASFTKQCGTSLSKFLNAKQSKRTITRIKAQDVEFENLLSALMTIRESFYSLKSYDLLSEQYRGEIEAELKSLTDVHNDSGESWGKIFEHSILTYWLHILEDRHACLALVRSGKADDIRKKYAQLLDEKNEYSAFKLSETIKASTKNPSSQKLMQSLKADVGRQRNVKTLRKFNETYIADTSYRKLVPVWLASPESVSDIFPLTVGLFDVVIFDEASQCTVESGVPAVLRGKQIIVAGDEKQLPPSHIFEMQIDNQDEEESFASNEPSLLSLAKKTPDFRYKMLEWHYRSKFEELINFSNYVFYEGKIKISPNVSLMSKGRESAIVWHSVTGYWENRSNRVEADKVLERLRHYLTHSPDVSVGIVTFNINQKKLIEDLIDAEELHDPEFRELLAQNHALPIDRQLFVKNIENVQGDERDVIIFSVGYAPTAPGERVYQMFGSLSQQGGENRLNVAISRAISKIEIVSSIDPEKDLSPSGTHAGPKIFRDYLCYAKAVAEGDLRRALDILNDYNPSTMTNNHVVNKTESPLEDEIFEALRELGYEVHCQVGQSGYRIDLAVVNPDDISKYLLGIECDGCKYHSSISARERDVFRQRFLESRGWKIHRIWSPNWWHNKEVEIAKTRNLIESLRSQRRKVA